MGVAYAPANATAETKFVASLAARGVRSIANEQRARLGRTFGCVRLVWHKTLEERHRTYHDEGRRISYKETDAALTRWKKTEELAFLGEVSSAPLQQTLGTSTPRLENFFAGRARYPRFKSRNGRQSAHYTRSAFRMREGQLFLAKQATPLRFVWSWDAGTFAALDPTMVVVSRDADGRWYVTVNGCSSRAGRCWAVCWCPAGSSCPHRPTPAGTPRSRPRTSPGAAVARLPGPARS